MNDKQAVMALGNQIGFGNMMYLASECWKNIHLGDIGAFVVGPCLGMTAPCGCDMPGECDWCCGTQWLTIHVKKMKDSIK